MTKTARVKCQCCASTPYTIRIGYHCPHCQLSSQETRKGVIRQTESLQMEWEQSFDDAWLRTFGEIIKPKALIRVRDEWKKAIRAELLRAKQEGKEDERKRLLSEWERVKPKEKKVGITQWERGYDAGFHRGLSDADTAIREMLKEGNL